MMLLPEVSIDALGLKKVLVVCSTALTAAAATPLHTPSHADESTPPHMLLRDVSCCWGSWCQVGFVQASCRLPCHCGLWCQDLPRDQPFP